jgi:tetratricopeptide (TPR) repeat protein
MRALALAFWLSSCSGMLPSEENRELGSHPALNRWIKPLRLDLSRSLDETAALEAHQKVNGIYYFLVGRLKSQDQQSAPAIVALERVRGLDPESAELHLSLAQEYLKASRLQEGVALVRKALELRPAYRDAKFLLANLHANAKQYSEAFQLFQELAVENPDDEDVVLYLALMDIEQKDLNSAQMRLHRFLERNPDSASANFYAGRLYQERGQNDRALESYLKAIDLRPGFVQAGTYLGYLQEELGLKAEAAETYSWLSVQTDEATYHRKLGQLYLEMSQYSLALKALQNLHRLDPSDLNNRIKMGLVWVELKEPELAKEAFEGVLEESPDSDNVRFYLANLLEGEGRQTQALKHYDRFKSGSKFFVDALRRRLVILAESGRVKEGERLMQGLRQQKIGEDGALGAEDYFDLMVTLYEQAGLRKQALVALDEALDAVPQSERLLYVKGTLLEKEARFDEATEVMKALLRKNPQHAGALNFVGYVWADQGIRLNEAELMIRQALQLRPEDPYILDSLGWVQFRLGRNQEAYKTLKQAMSLKPDEAIILDHLGDVLVKLNRIEEALELYERVRVLGFERDHERVRFDQKWASFSKRLEQDCAAARLRLSVCGRGVFNGRAPASTPGPRDVRHPF